MCLYEHKHILIRSHSQISGRPNKLELFTNEHGKMEIFSVFFPTKDSKFQTLDKSTNLLCDLAKPFKLHSEFNVETTHKNPPNLYFF